MTIGSPLLLLLTSAFVLGFPPQDGKAGADPQILMGDWHGDSICTVRPSACHDEKALYHVKAVPGAPHQYTIDADKIVDGKPEFMGRVDCTYSADTHTLICSTPRLVLTLEGKTLNGTMNQPDGTVWRKITLQHD